MHFCFFQFKLCIDFLCISSYFHMRKLPVSLCSVNMRLERYWLNINIFTRELILDFHLNKLFTQFLKEKKWLSLIIFWLKKKKNHLMISWTERKNQMNKNGFHLTAELQERLIFTWKFHLHKKRFLEQCIIDRYVGR